MSPCALRPPRTPEELGGVSLPGCVGGVTVQGLAQEECRSSDVGKGNSGSVVWGEGRFGSTSFVSLSGSMSVCPSCSWLCHRRCFVPMSVLV